MPFTSIRSLGAILAASFTLGAIACTPACSARRIEFILCPSEVRSQMEKETDLGRRREFLYPLDYEVVLIERRDERVVPASVSRAEHTTGWPVAITVTLEKPTHVSDFIILHPSRHPLGVAIRHDGERDYHVQWLTPQELDATRRAGVLYLQPLASLPILSER